MEAIPVVDLRLLTQAEINALSRACSSAAGDTRRYDDVVVPKIDRSVFNESAGSRKQTYSRLRLAPRKPPDLAASPSSSSGAARGRRPSGGLLVAPAAAALPPPLPPPTAPEVVDEPGRRENEQIIFFLRQLFAKNGVEIVDKAAANDDSAAVASAAVPSTGVNANPSLVGSALGKRGREQDVAEAVNKDWEVVNVNGVAVDLAGLWENDDPFRPELMRRTQGLVMEEEFLSFLSGLEGQWGSRRKRRRIVDAANFGDALPKGWKLLLALKRKDGNIWLHCRRYISPSGKQFISCKEVSSYLVSLIGSDNVRQLNAVQDSADKLGNGHAVGHSHQVDVTSRSLCSPSAKPISAFSADYGKQIVLYGVENTAKAQVQDILKCQECNLTFADEGAHVQHLLTFHRSSRKKRRVGQSIVDGVIIRDGKYECQFCHKMFTERRRYNGHVGIHVKYNVRSLERPTDDIVMEKNVTSSDGAASAFSQHSNLVSCEEETKLVVENMSTESICAIIDSYPQGNEHGGNTVSDHKFCDKEREKTIVHEICNTGAIDEMKNSLPLSNVSDNDTEKNITGEKCPLLNHESNDGSPGNNSFIESNNDHTMECFDSEKDAEQELCNGQCSTEINSSSPLNVEVKKVDCLPEFNNETNKSGSMEIDHGKTCQKPIEAAEDGSVRNGDVHTCLNCTPPSLTDAGNCTSEVSSRNDLSNRIVLDEMESPSKVNTSYENAILQDGQKSLETVTLSESVMDGIENIENKIRLDTNLNILSGTEQSDTRNTAAICMAEELVQMAKSGNEPQDDLECSNTASDNAVILENVVHGEILLSGTDERFFGNPVMVPSGRNYCDIDTAIDGMLPSSGEEIMLEIMGQSNNELNDDLMSDGIVLDADAPRNDTGIADEGNLQSLCINMEASWEEASAHLPILDMISDQDNGHLHRGANGDHEEISCFEDMRLDDIEPQKLMVSAGLDSRQHLEEPMVDATGLENGPGPCIELGWASGFSSLGLRRRFTTVCVWCCTEFEHDYVDIEVQPGSVGFMCPTCKVKISGHM